MFFADANSGWIVGELGLILHYDGDTGIENEETPELVTKNSLNQNYPNPFNPSTTISFNLTTENMESAELVIYNLKGQMIKQYSIFNNQSSIVWKGVDDFGNPVSSGIYLYKLKVNGKTEEMKKCLLLK
ncbi:MAG: T9SS type A sorting domain-containing protein [FCB group bacterium]|nr:T9SS type A sorting domain-containing protein [FCB group bacterium]